MAHVATVEPPSSLEARYARVRALTDWLVAPLEPEDMVVQSMPDCSPTKWHLAHTSWFFETFVLGSSARYQPHHPEFGRLFNSYYLQAGTPWPRDRRGVLARPTCAEVARYRRHVDAAMGALAAGTEPALARLIETGLHHEQQHQELILTDLKHLFGLGPLAPRYRRLPVSSSPPAVRQPRWVALEGGAVEIGAQPAGFSFDNERPRHVQWVAPFLIADRLVTNGEYREFIGDGGYARSALWLSDGWYHLKAHGIRRPLYWTDDLQTHYTLGGPAPLDPAAPVAHVSYFEADAYARWAGARLPREAEWELAAADVPVQGNFLDSGLLEPVPAGDSPPGASQLFGDAWEWTQTAYGPYPGYRPEPAPLTEYNGKFMSGQMVLRGGSCLSPRDHIRATYRNFLPPGARWQVTGIRLASDP